MGNQNAMSDFDRYGGPNASSVSYIAPIPQYNSASVPERHQLTAHKRIAANQNTIGVAGSIFDARRLTKARPCTDPAGCTPQNLLGQTMKVHVVQLALMARNI
jgi:hypothetical protein